MVVVVVVQSITSAGISEDDELPLPSSSSEPARLPCCEPALEPCFEPCRLPWRDGCKLPCTLPCCEAAREAGRLGPRLFGMLDPGRLEPAALCMPANDRSADQSDAFLSSVRTTSKPTNVFPVPGGPCTKPSRRVRSALAAFSCHVSSEEPTVAPSEAVGHSRRTSAMR